MPPSLKQPREISDFLVYRLFRLVTLALRGTDAVYRRELGVSRREWRILAYLAKAPDASLKALASDSGIDMVVTSRCVTGMVDRGLLSKQRGQSNKRVVCLRLTERGREMHDIAQALGARFNQRFASCLSDEDAVRMEELLRKLERQAEAIDLTHD